MTAFHWQTAVIKIGSALVSPDGEGTSVRYLSQIADFIIDSKNKGKNVVLVSSGSVAAARGIIKTGHRVSPGKKSAMAAIGQTKLMARWTGLFDFTCAQLLLTVEDLNDRKRFVNIQNTMEQLLARGVLPIVNENDTVTNDESTVGDNDNLAAHTAIALQADCLIICTDVDGLYNANPKKDKTAKLIKQVPFISEEVLALAGGAGSSVGTGGMITKLQAAQKCEQSGIQTLLVNGTKPDTFSKVIGKFDTNDAVLVSYAGRIIGKGLAAYPSSAIEQIKGKKSKEISTILGYSASTEVLHRDDFVLIEESETHNDI